MLEDHFRGQGWVVRQGKGEIGFHYRKDQPYGRDEVTWGAEKSVGWMKPYFGLGTKIHAVHEVLMEIGATGVMSPPPDKDKKTITTHPAKHLSGAAFAPLQVDCVDEREVRRYVGVMIDFLENIGLPFLNKYSDLKVLDAEINGDSPWYDTEGKLLGLPNFNVTRLVIAKLTGNPRYEALVDATFRYYEVESAKSGYPFVYDRTDLSKPIPATVEILKKVKPLGSE